MMTFKISDFKGEEKEQFESLLKEILELDFLLDPGSDERWHKNQNFDLHLQHDGGDVFIGKLFKVTNGYSSLTNTIAEAEIQFFEDGVPLVFKEFNLFKTITKQVTILTHSAENAVEQAMEADNTAWVTVRQSNVDVGL